MPTFRIVPGPPHSGLTADGRTPTSPPAPAISWASAAPSSICPAAIARTAAAEIATVRGTGKPMRTSRCRHLARHPCRAVSIGADGVISTTADGGAVCSMLARSLSARPGMLQVRNAGQAAAQASRSIQTGT